MLIANTIIILIKTTNFLLHLWFCSPRGHCTVTTEYFPTNIVIERLYPNRNRQKKIVERYYYYRSPIL